MVGVNKSTILRWLRGDVSMSAPRKREVALALGKPADWLFDDVLRPVPAAAEEGGSGRMVTLPQRYRVVRFPRGFGYGWRVIEPIHDRAVQEYDTRAKAQRAARELNGVTA